MQRFLWVILLVSVGCFSGDDSETKEQPNETGGDPEDTDPTPEDSGDTEPQDADGDGLLADEDCDDDDASVGGPSVWYADVDEDGYGSEHEQTEACEAPDGHVAEAGDCDDFNQHIHPGADPECGNHNMDLDCDGVLDCEQLGLNRIMDYDDSVIQARYESSSLGWTSSDFNQDGVVDLLVYDGTSEAGIFQGDVKGELYLNEAPFVVTHSEEVITLDSLDFDQDGSTDLLVSAGGDEDRDGNFYLVFGPISGSSSSVDFETTDIGFTANFIHGSQTGTSNTIRAPLPVGDVVSSGRPDIAFQEGSRCYLISGEDYGDPYFGRRYVGYNDDYSALVMSPDHVDVDEYQGAGDVNGDGVDDLVVALSQQDQDSYEDAGAVSILYGPVSGTTYVPGGDVDIAGSRSNNQIGGRLQAPGDVDGDGLADLVVETAKHDRDDATVYLFTGISSSTTSIDDAVLSIGADEDTYNGVTVHFGELDGEDGVDLVAGTPNWEYEFRGPVGGVHVFYGPPLEGTLDVDGSDLTFFGEGVDDMFGTTVDIIDDMDGDGSSELLVFAAERSSLSSEDLAAIYLLEFSDLP